MKSIQRYLKNVSDGKQGTASDYVVYVMMFVLVASVLIYVALTGPEDESIQAISLGWAIMISAFALVGAIICGWVARIAYLGTKTRRNAKKPEPDRSTEAKI